MGTKNTRKTVDLEFQPEHFRVHTEAIDALFHGKTHAYTKRFKSWAQRTQGEHLENLVNALLSNLAFTIAVGTKSGVSDDRLRGRADGILLIKQFIKLHASGHQDDGVTNSDAGDLTDLI